MTRPDYLVKFNNNWTWSRQPLAAAAPHVIELVEDLETIGDISAVTRLLQPPD
ncbi:MAG: hypothetical protein GKR94_14535 [Gammaproteobacteria bacterium]|nr:hypothetical protein [Gammaproteobacteria bacterium]